jgi:hypothetical protein
MTLFRDDTTEFRRAVVTTARRLNIPEAIVEKDYWISQVLRAVNAAHYGQYVLKGGTSLSKGYRMISRFSEDVDLLLIPQAKDGEGGVVEALLEQIERAISDLTGLDTTREKAEEGVATISVAPYPGVLSEYSKQHQPQIRVDHGVPGGPIPSESRDLAMMLVDQFVRAEQDFSLFDDLQPCQITMLHPARTLVEKLCVVDGIGRRIEAGNKAVRSREARHYYDLWHLLDTNRSPAIQYLQEHETVELLYEDCARITERFYGSAPERPDGGFASSVAFSPEVVSVVGNSYEKMCSELVFPDSDCPSLQDVVERIRANSGDL